jgi:anaerobic sulfite reductase subunit A
LNQSADSEREVPSSPSDPEKVNTARAGIYSFLSRAFKAEIDEQFLRSIVAVEPIIRSLSDSENGEESKEFEEGSRELLGFATKVESLSDSEKKSLLQDLAVEYASLFLGVGVKHVYLVESVYLGKDHLLYEEPFHAVLEAYRSLGFEKAKDFAEPEDHVAVEFDFMANLCRWTAQTLEKRDVQNALAYLNLQKEFLTDHISKWVPDLCRKLDDAASTGFYKALANLTLGFISVEKEMPDHMIGILKKTFSVEIKKIKIEKDTSVTYYS